MQSPFPRVHGDIQTAVVNLVDSLVPLVPVERQPSLAREIARVLAGRPSTMANSMFLRQSIIRRRRASLDEVIDGLAAWVTVLFDLGNLRHDRSRALDLTVAISDASLERLARALSGSKHGCILALPHVGSMELFVAYLQDRGFNLGFVFSIGTNPTPTELWLLEGRRGTQATPIPFATRNTGAMISRHLQAGGLVCMVVDVYPSERYQGIPVQTFGARFPYPPGPARYAQRYGTSVLPACVSSRDAAGISVDVLSPVESSDGLAGQQASLYFTQRLADQIGRFTAEHAGAFWLWHPIPNDPFERIAEYERPGLLVSPFAGPHEDEATAVAVEAMQGLAGRA